ncbi:uncharacterized protein LOC34622709 [Cyclospora cayetanensis]|uniref:Uncharacterized protein LOC34622709 n=1 Tax=Cyclospora cayetanensis TaxID=88456 RepID=A0A6P6RSX4_9EIME|nr:uncharacterized protein LOC34622709 [Cyclospora cayetanensis]
MRSVHWWRAAAAAASAVAAARGAAGCCSIVGGGLSGLAMAFHLQQQPELCHARIKIIETQPHLGGRYISTEPANAGVLHGRLDAPPSSQAGSIASQHGLWKDELPKGQQRELVPLLMKTLHDCSYMHSHVSLSPAALRPGRKAADGPPCKGGSQREGSTVGHEHADIPLEFGAGVPHLLAPGGAHVLRLMQHLLMPSQLLTARRQAGSLFSLARSSVHPARGAAWLTPLRRLKPRGPTLDAQPKCSPGLSRRHVLRALCAGVRESFLTPEKVASKQRRLGHAEAPNDMSVSAFAELHASKTLANAVLLPAFGSCSYAGDAEALSASAYFPRAWLLHSQYGSLLRGSWVERRLLRRSGGQGGHKSSGGIEAPVDADDRHIMPVEGCKAFPHGHEGLQRVASEGAGVFAPVGGMRQLVEALARHIRTPNASGPPISVVSSSRVVRIARSLVTGSAKPAAEVVCEDGSRHSADLVICAVHPYDLGIILRASKEAFDEPEDLEQPLGKSASTGGRQAESKEAHTSDINHTKEARRSTSVLAELLLSLPCASWVSVHAFAAYTSRRAASLGRGCLYPPTQPAAPLSFVSEHEASTAPPQRSVPVHDAQRDGEEQVAIPSNAVAEASAAVLTALQAAEEALTVAELQLPGNLFPHAQAEALSAAGLFDSSAAPWVSRAALLHAQASVRVHRLETLLEHMQQLLLPLQRLLQAEGPSWVRRESSEDRMAAGVRALGLLMSAAEAAVVRTLLREGIVTPAEQLVLSSRLALQAEPQWPVLLRHPMEPRAAAQRGQLFYLLQRFEQLREEQWNGAPLLHAALGHVPPVRDSQVTLTPPESPAVEEQAPHSRQESPTPKSFAEARVLFHQLRLKAAPWLQVVGPAGSFCEWGAGARVKDAAILAHQVAQRFASFPNIRPETSDDFMARLNGGWLGVLSRESREGEFDGAKRSHPSKPQGRGAEVGMMSYRGRAFCSSEVSQGSSLSHSGSQQVKKAPVWHFSGNADRKRARHPTR